MVGFFSGFPRIQNASAICANEQEIVQAGQLPPGDSGFRLSLTLDFKSPNLTKEWTRWRSLDTLPNASILRQLARFYRVGRSEDDPYRETLQLLDRIQRAVPGGQRCPKGYGQDKGLRQVRNPKRPKQDREGRRHIQKPDKTGPGHHPAHFLPGGTQLRRRIRRTDQGGPTHSAALSSQMASPSRGTIEEALLCVYDVRNNTSTGI